MADNNVKFGLTDGVKKLLLAGIGAVAVTAEKSQEVLDDLVERGEITVEQDPNCGSGGLNTNFCPNCGNPRS